LLPCVSIPLSPLPRSLWTWVLRKRSRASQQAHVIYLRVLAPPQIIHLGLPGTWSATPAQTVRRSASPLSSLPPCLPSFPRLPCLSHFPCLPLCLVHDGDSTNLGARFVLPICNHVVTS
jgi:hypothetical protein